MLNRAPCRLKFKFCCKFQPCLFEKFLIVLNLYLKKNFFTDHFRAAWTYETMTFTCFSNVCHILLPDKRHTNLVTKYTYAIIFRWELNSEDMLKWASTYFVFPLTRFWIFWLIGGLALFSRIGATKEGGLTLDMKSQFLKLN